MSGKIGTISHKITKQFGADEIRFAIPVTNTSPIEQCYLIHLYDSHDTFIASHPAGRENYVGKADKVLPGITETMHIDSNWEDWNISHVAGQILTFKLKADPTKLLGFCEAGYFGIDDYKVVDTKEYNLGEHVGDKPLTEEVEDIVKLFITLLVVIIIAKLVSEFT